MSSFTRPLTVTKLKSGKWRVERGFRYWVGAENSGVYVDVPRYFKTDFASVPRLFWSILPPDGKYSQAAVLHDWMYFSSSLPRKRADQIFLEAMGVLGVSWWKRHTMYRAVRMFGGLHKRFSSK